jgi:copper chaperone CopZ
MSSMQKIHLTIEGMSCGHCVARVRRTLEAMDGVRVTSVDIGTADAEIDPQRIEPEALARAVSDAGYTARAATIKAA